MTGEDVQELGQLVNPAAAEEMPEGRDPVRFHRVVRTAHYLVHRAHSAEFHRAERTAIAAHPGLNEEQRAGIPDRVDHQQDQCGKHDKRQGCNRD